jgi:hypothetical protein
MSSVLAEFFVRLLLGSKGFQGDVWSVSFALIMFDDLRRGTDAAVVADQFVLVKFLIETLNLLT